MNPAHRVRRWLAAPFAGRPYQLQRLRWPNPFRPPWQQAEINLCRTGELGDVVMALAVVRAIRERNPAARINFVTEYHEFLAGHPLLDRVLSPAQAQAAGLRNVVELRYEVFVPPPLHLIDYFAGCVGLRGIARDIPLPDYTGELGDLRSAVPATRPWIMVCRNAGPFTPNKDWPADRWDRLVAQLARDATVVDLGQPPAVAPAGPRHVDLRGRTSIRQYCALLSLADLVITPVTSAVHIAAAYQVPTVSVLGGYESPANTAYPRHTALHRPVPCSPCWLRTPCPYDRKCLGAISVEDVRAAALALLQKWPPRPRIGGAGHAPP